MNTESIIKLFILFGTLYLFMKCLEKQENFDAKKYDFKKPAQLTILDDKGVSYNIVSLEQFNPEHQKKIINYMTKNTPGFLNTAVPVNSFSPMPMFLVRLIDLEKYVSTNTSNFYIAKMPENKITFMPIINDKITAGQFIYMHPMYNILCYSRTNLVSRMIHIDNYDDIRPSSIKPIQIDNLDLFTFDMTGQKNIKHLIKQ